MNVMKMAKANENDMNAALEMCRALEALEGGYLPSEMTPDDDCVAYYADEHAEKVVEHLVAIAKRASLFRVCFGMTVLLDPLNELVDPNADTLEAHPKLTRIAAQLDKLLEFAKECARTEGLMVNGNRLSMKAQELVSSVEGEA